MSSNKALNKSIIIILLFVFSIIAFYTGYSKQSGTLEPDMVFEVLSFSDFAHSIDELNKVAALAGIGLIALAFLSGPLSRLWPKTCAWLLPTRKYVGIGGFILAALHSIYAIIIFYDLDLNQILLENPHALAIILGIIAILIFALITFTSTKKAVKQMGYSKWKTIQTTGYVALLLAVIHFILLETKPEIGLSVRPYGLLFLAIAIIALAMKGLMILIQSPEKKSYEEHIGESKKKK
ncbi:MAG: hypothetical protein CL944_03015 [Candidatus Diapherotrites archaeon]|uniref:Ferric oxidoreductase domain-containing protein n=1 Tax=Candidatus Iainarchaeum sp. TaxID=3101447 RepID=A0A2D6LQF6_9ARCH|nr:hypothetical protein [Candidatus Diapherotrites archaeon]|tara:strand:+ start:2491 stop:3201 length:711 start_codon:yes stop_codon:yes gene_type:complete